MNWLKETFFFHWLKETLFLLDAAQYLERCYFWSCRRKCSLGFMHSGFASGPLGNDQGGSHVHQKKGEALICRWKVELESPVAWLVTVKAVRPHL